MPCSPNFSEINLLVHIHPFKFVSSFFWNLSSVTSEEDWRVFLPLDITSLRKNNLPFPDRYQLPKLFICFIMFIYLICTSGCYTQWSPNLGRRGCNTDVPFRAEYFMVFYSLHCDCFRASMLITIYCTIYWPMHQFRLYQAIESLSQCCILSA